MMGNYLYIATIIAIIILVIWIIKTINIISFCNIKSKESESKKTYYDLQIDITKNELKRDEKDAYKQAIYKKYDKYV